MPYFKWIPAYAGMTKQAIYKLAGLTCTVKELSGPVSTVPVSYTHLTLPTIYSV